MEGLIVLLLLAAIYMLPTIIGAQRNVPNVGSIAILNVFLGWTLVGWVVALAMAARTVPRPIAAPTQAATKPRVAARTVPAIAAPAQATSEQQSVPMYRECPHCKEQMRRDASVCPHCRMGTEPWTRNDGAWWTKDAAGGWQYLDEATNTWKPQVIPPTTSPGEADISSP